MFLRAVIPTLLLLLLSASSLVASIPVEGEATLETDTGATDRIEEDVPPTLKSNILDFVFKSDYHKAKKNKIKEEFDKYMFPPKAAEKFSAYLMTNLALPQLAIPQATLEIAKKIIKRKWKQSSFEEMERISKLVIEQLGNHVEGVQAVEVTKLQTLLEAAITQENLLVVETILHFLPDEGDIMELAVVLAVRTSYNHFKSNHIMVEVLRVVLEETITSNATRNVALIEHALSKIRGSTTTEKRQFAVELSRILHDTYWHTFVDGNFKTYPYKCDPEHDLTYPESICYFRSNNH